MGFARSTSIHAMPGVIVQVSTVTVTTYVGRTRLLGATPVSTPAGPASLGSPMPTTPGQYFAPAPGTPAPAPRPGLLAPKEEKALYAYGVTRTAAGLDPLVLQHHVYGQAAAALLGLRLLHAGDHEACVRHLQSAIHAPEPVETNLFVLKYLPGFSFTLEIAGGVSVRLPLTHAALTLALAEGLQSLGRGPEAIQYIEQLEPTLPALLSLTELYSDRRDWEEVLRLTDGVNVDSDVTALLAILRSQAHLELGHRVAAAECLKPVTENSGLSRNVRFKALVLRSNIHLAENEYGRAVADLEKIMAEDSQIPGIREAVARFRKISQDTVEAEEVPARRTGGRAAGFYPDPEGVAPFRYWDGEAWTSRVRMTQL